MFSPHWTQAGVGTGQRSFADPVPTPFFIFVDNIGSQPGVMIEVKAQRSGPVVMHHHVRAEWISSAMLTTILGRVSGSRDKIPLCPFCFFCPD
jgi:hypothetical protein